MRISKQNTQNNEATPTQKVLEAFSNGKPWNTELAFSELLKLGMAGAKRTAERQLKKLGLWPNELTSILLTDEFGKPLNLVVLNSELVIARSKRKLVLFAQIHKGLNGHHFLHANNAKGGRTWVAIKDQPNDKKIQKAFNQLQDFFGKPLQIFPHGMLTAFFRNNAALQKINPLTAYRESFYPPNQTQKTLTLPPHLAKLEAESIHIIREAVAQSRNPVMLYSIGKDSSVMLRLAQKAFYPGKLPFPLLHIDTRWKFQAMYDMRNEIAKDPNLTLITHTNPQAIENNINPFDHGSTLHTDITKTEGLKQALDQYQFDVIFGGARRDEEKSRAKERIFSFRSKTHHWDSKSQRPELWNLFNARIHPSESIRVFPLSNWTELDVWQYIYHEDIPVVPLYFAKERPIVERNQLLLMVDDERFRFQENEKIRNRLVRFRTLGCYPLTGAIESNAKNVPEIILELISARQTERQGRVIDSDANASMEKKKQEGYF